MNYIRHLTGFFDRISNEENLNPTHISLYLSLFQYWNMNRFQNPISITRDEIMKISKICAKATYHKCMKDLHNLGYLRYVPSYNPFKGSLVYLFIFEPDYQPDQKISTQQIKNQPGTETATGTGTEQALVPSINYINNTNILNNENNCSENSEKQNSGNQNFFTKEKGSNETGNHSKRNTKTDNNRSTTKSCTEKKENIPPSLPEVIQFFESQNYPIFEAQKFFNHFQSNGWKVGGKSPMKDWNAAARNWMLNFNKFNPPLKSNSTNLSKNKNYGEPL
jgi:hypothetical protein